MQPSEIEIQREVEALRDIRRRSTSQGSLTLDPDLPNATSPVSPSATYWSQTTTPNLTDADSSSSSHENSSWGGSQSDDPLHLFWVPANVHPEIAPAEFRAFLKEHARTVPADGAGTPERSNSTLSTRSFSRLGRKRSMLSKQYDPAADDGVESEAVTPLRRNRTGLGSKRASPQLTINDLQRLEELAEEAQGSDDPEKLRMALRRTLSMNVSPTADKMDGVQTTGDTADAPIIVPLPGQILRRTARTKIRKPGLAGDGGGHRFGASRKIRSNTAPPVPSLARSSEDLSSNENESVESAGRDRTLSNEGTSLRPSEEDPQANRLEAWSDDSSLIYDSYLHEPEELETQIPVVVTPPPMGREFAEQIPDILQPPPSSGPYPIPSLQHPQPHRMLSEPIVEDRKSLSRTPSPEQPSPDSSQYHISSPQSPPRDQPSSFLSVSPTSPPPVAAVSPPKREKDKKGLFKWGDKSGKKGGKEKEKEKEKDRHSGEKDKESGFFGSIFGSKKKQDDNSSQSMSHHGRETAAAMLGGSKSRAGSRSVSPAGGMNGSYARYPIHVERAIYRLSHIKLANPRRPLYEQVLISNLMFWYLGVINKTQPSPTTPTPTGPTAQNPAAQENEMGQRGRDMDEKTEVARAEKERMEREAAAAAQPQKKEPKRGSLTKTPSTGSVQSNRRTAETPIKAPQYDVQHSMMEQEYAGLAYANPQPQQQGRYSGQAPSPHHQVAPYHPQQGHNAHGQHHQSPGHHPQRSRSPPQQAQYSHGGQQMYSQQPYFQNQQFQDPNEYYNPPNTAPGHLDFQKPSSPNPNLPPGAMPPASVEQPWNATPRQRSPSAPSLQLPQQNSLPPNQASPRGRSPSETGHSQRAPADQPRRSGGTSPPTQPGARLPTRSHSATAVPPATFSQQNGRRKVASAHAVAPQQQKANLLRRQSEDEDVPLALWQQQRRK